MIAVVSHDAGGAEILSSYVARQQLQCVYVLDGPARKIFERKLGGVDAQSLEGALAVADWVLSGTSWQSDLELDAIRLARSKGKRSVAFLDHWVNYRERFTRSRETQLPDEIWVGDRIALDRARAAFPDTPVTLVRNPYFLDLEDALGGGALPKRPSRAGGEVNILYVSEPIRAHALLRFGDERHWGYVEEDALRYFLTNIYALGASVGRVVIRPHPSEPADKYDAIAAEFALPISRGGQDTLITEVADSDIVVGCNSMAMVVGLLAGKRVVSVIPPGGSPCVLPQPEIQSLQGLVASRRS
jgi:hypothetical protein